MVPEKFVCNNLEIEHREELKELLGQFLEPPEHFIEYREYLDNYNKVLRGRGELTIGTSFRGNEKILKLHKFIIRPRSDFKRFVDFVEAVRYCLTERLWEYVKDGSSDKSTGITIPQILIKLYDEIIEKEEVDSYTVEYVLPRFKSDTEPLSSIIILHILLDLLVKFFEKISKKDEDYILSTGKILKKFEKRVYIDIGFSGGFAYSVDEDYTVEGIDEIESLKREGIKGLKIIKMERRKREILNQVMLNQSLLHTHHRLIQESIEISH